MACVYAREVTKLTYLLLKSNEPNLRHVSLPDTPSPPLTRLLVRSTLNNNKIWLVRSFIRALFTAPRRKGWKGRGRNRTRREEDWNTFEETSPGASVNWIHLRGSFCSFSSYRILKQRFRPLQWPNERNWIIYPRWRNFQAISSFRSYALMSLNSRST